MELQTRDIKVKSSPVHGFGVFSLENIASGETIEECPTLIIDAHDSPVALDNYLFHVVNRDGSYSDDYYFLPLGGGAIYNHSPTPNALYAYDVDDKVMRVTAIKPISIGEEIFVSYGKEWFSSRMIKPLQSSPSFNVKRLLFGPRRLIRPILFIVGLCLAITLLH